MRRLLLLLSILFVPACDSGNGGTAGDDPDPAAPDGSFVIEPIWFRLSQLVEPDVGGVEDLQAWIEGDIVFTVVDGAIAGSGRCTVRRRRHKAWLGETSDKTETLPFSAAGTIEDGRIVLTLQGCAWAMARYTGTFSDGRYELRLGDLSSGPVWNPDVWNLASQLAGDDPRDLAFARD